MFSMIYFSLASALRFKPTTQDWVGHIADGDLHSAVGLVNGRETGSVSSAIDSLQMHADMNLVMGAVAEAEERYRLAQKLMRSTRHVLRIASCCNAGWQSLFRYRFDAAVSCFARIIDEPRATPPERALARLGIVCALHHLGRAADTSQALDAFATEVDGIGAMQEIWHDVLITLRTDLSIQNELRLATEIGDHAFWQSGLQADSASLGTDRLHYDSFDQPNPTALVDRLHVPLLRQRMVFLTRLRALARGDRNATADLGTHLRWAQRNNLIGYERTVRLETALAALVAGLPLIAEGALDPLQKSSHVGGVVGRDLDYLYCLAKIRQLQGRTHESLPLYSDYAVTAMHCLRVEAHMLARFANRTAIHMPQRDDVGARLPPKYLRAYLFLLENINSRDLSVRAMAAEIGVSERALQSTFKRCLGMSPIELIRRCRTEHRKAGLMNRSARSDAAFPRPEKPRQSALDEV
ncbi:helix-turn-helix transcriptional regulator [Burkholderia ambifaria]|uniref:Transcriptional regulator, AraC family n=1 Tax=Burkholderia ambifaria MEX-5 TaxID=396597 RepID=B1T0P4_9BURK|nr:AraC family transcriptional regulator [Burkholderia ambifaria]EDT42869.1 transcriptional regulator, AraC family [Burkholderia ambifaria MEX-5]